MDSNTIISVTLEHIYFHSLETKMSRFSRIFMGTLLPSSKYITHKLLISAASLYLSTVLLLSVLSTKTTCHFIKHHFQINIKRFQIRHLAFTYYSEAFLLFPISRISYLVSSGLPFQIKYKGSLIVDYFHTYINSAFIPGHNYQPYLTPLFVQMHYSNYSVLHRALNVNCMGFFFISLC